MGANKLTIRHDGNLHALLSNGNEVINIVAGSMEIRQTMNEKRSWFARVSLELYIKESDIEVLSTPVGS